jgi:hypothetical protein
MLSLEEQQFFRDLIASAQVEEVISLLEELSATRKAAHRNYVRQYTKEAVDMFVAAMRDEKMDMRFRLEAANWLVERGYGKPAMQVAAQSENDGSEQKEFRTVEEIRLFLLERGIDVARVPPPFAVIEGKTC